MSNELNIELLAEKKIRGNLEADESGVLEDWLAADPLHRKEFEELCEILLLTDAGLEAVDPQTDAQWAELEGAIGGQASVSGEKRRRIPRRGWAVAASVVLLAAVGFFFLRGYLNQNSVENSLVYTAGNQEKLVSLPDQSEVRLKPGARLSLAADFNESDRQMELEGAAVFTVARDEAKPFVVKGGDTETKVLGTVFELNTNGGQQKVQLRVLSGKVSFQGAKSDSPAILTANMHGHYDARSGEIRLEASELLPTDNQQEKIVVRDQPLAEVLPRIEKLYKIKMEISPELLQTRLTATFESDGEEDMIAALELILDGKFEKKGGTYTFAFRP